MEAMQTKGGVFSQDIRTTAATGMRKEEVKEGVLHFF